MPSQLEFAVLGPLTARRGGDVLDLGAPQQRAVLAPLLRARGRQVPVDALVDAVWEEPPQAARGIVRTYVSRLRRSLQPGAGDSHEVIALSGNGYLMRHEGVAVDVERFAQLTQAARAAVDNGGAGLAEAGECLREAAGLWRGEPLAGVPGPYAESQRVRLAELRLTAAEDRLAIGIELGGHAAGVAELRELAASQPLRERLRELLMLALYRAGRQAEALAVFEDTRRLLGDELGIDPGPALRRMHQRILQMDDALLVVPRPQATVTTVLPRPPGPLVRPAQLPPDAPGFAGRRRELALLGSLLGDAGDTPPAPAIASIDGMPGVGKTALAVHWAHQVAGRFPDGVLYADLGCYRPDVPVMTSSGALCAFLDALGVAPGRLPGNRAAQVGLYRSLLHGRRMLILVDNASCEEDVRPLLPGTGGSTVIVTSRNQLTGLIATHDARPVPLEPLSAGDSRSMLASRLGPLRAAAEPAAVREITELCAGLPLALAVAAARASAGQGRSLAATAGELRDPGTRLCLLSTGDAAADLCAAFSASYQQLSLPARRLFRLLGRHDRAVFTLATAVSLAAITEAKARPLLNELAAARLLGERPAGQYAFHDLMGLYAAGLTGAQGTGHDEHAVLGTAPGLAAR